MQYVNVAHIYIAYNSINAACRYPATYETVDANAFAQVLFHPYKDKGHLALLFIYQIYIQPQC